MSHYGPYGNNCINTGQFDAGECWLCTLRRQAPPAADYDPFNFSTEQICEALGKAALAARAKYVGYDDEDWNDAVGITVLLFVQNLAKEADNG